MSLTARTLWESGVEREVAWWRGYLASGGGDDREGFRARFDPDLPLQPVIEKALAQSVPDGEPAVLDCAAGPATTVGKRLHGKPIHLVAVDALANRYREILAQLGLTPPVFTEQCEAERLEACFAPGEFDLVYIRFALDHVYDPERALRQMALVCRAGGAIVIEQYRDDHVDEYQGLKQWGLHPLDDDLLITNNRERFTLRQVLHEWVVQVDAAPDWLTVTARKPYGVND